METNKLLSRVASLNKVTYMHTYMHAHITYAHSSNKNIQALKVYLHILKIYNNMFVLQMPGYGVICKGSTWTVGQNYFVSLHLSGEHLVHGLFERRVDILLSKMFPSQKHSKYRENGWLNCIQWWQKLSLASWERVQGNHIEDFETVFYSNSFRV